MSNFSRKTTPAVQSQTQPIPLQLLSPTTPRATQDPSGRPAPAQRPPSGRRFVTRPEPPPPQAPATPGPSTEQGTGPRPRRFNPPLERGPTYENETAAPSHLPATGEPPPIGVYAVRLGQQMAQGVVLQPPEGETSKEEKERHAAQSFMGYWERHWEQMYLTDQRQAQMIVDNWARHEDNNRQADARQDKTNQWNRNTAYRVAGATLTAGLLFTAANVSARRIPPANSTPSAQDGSQNDPVGSGSFTGGSTLNVRRNQPPPRTDYLNTMKPDGAPPDPNPAGPAGFAPYSGPYGFDQPEPAVPDPDIGPRSNYGAQPAQPEQPTGQYQATPNQMPSRRTARALRV